MANPAQKPTEVRNTKQRRTVAATLDTLDDFITAQDLHQLMSSRGESVSLATTYRILQSMLGTGEVEALKTEGGEAIYRRCETEHHHHHILCRSCGAAVEFEVPELEEWAQKTAMQHGYTDISHVIEIVGLCSSCAAQG
ncbi:MAG: transcriptional repressor [Rothia sp. (in: high G+C Gram-positive bacteria)]|nr:transcriptional repressor [Rothia sp. (in: high G+C Gram-positive bacteria)]